MSRSLGRVLFVATASLIVAIVAPSGAGPTVRLVAEAAARLRAELRSEREVLQRAEGIATAGHAVPASVGASPFSHADTTVLPRIDDVDEQPEAAMPGELQRRCAAQPCQIDLHRIATLQSLQGADRLPQSAVHVAQDRAGRFLVRSASFDDILVFDANGRLASTAVGAGVPAFKAIGHLVVGPADSVWVHDYRAGLVVVLTSDLRVAKRHRSPFGPSYVRADGTWVVSAQIQTADLIGYPIHLADPGGAVLRSFGIDVPQYRSDLQLLTTRLVAPAVDGTVWAVAPGRYALERWDPLTGRLRQRVTIKSDWFSESAHIPSDERLRPKPVIESLWEQGGLVWFVLRDADLHWKAPPLANQERVRSPMEYEQTFDWVVEAVNPATGEVVGSSRFASALWARSGGLIASLGSESGGQRNGGISLSRVGLRISVPARENR